MKKVLIVATVVKTHIMEFHIPYLKMFKEMGWETAVAARNDYESPSDCVIPYCDSYFNVPFERNPLKIGNLKAYKILKKIINDGNFDLIHCHTPVGAMLTRLAAKKTRKLGTKVLYTAHGFHFYKGAPLINWVLYYPVEKWLSRYTDGLITINKEDYEIAKSFKAGKAYYVPGVGIDLKKYNVGYVDKNVKRKEIGVRADAFIMLSIGKFISRKNYEIVINAMSALKQDNKLTSMEYIIYGDVSYESELKELAEKNGLGENIHFLKYCNNLAELFYCSDLFVSISDEDKNPVTLLEAMASGTPIVCSNTCKYIDLIENEKSGLIVENTLEDVTKAIRTMIDDGIFRKNVASAALKKIKHYDLNLIMDDIIQLSNGNMKNLAILSIYKGQMIRKELGIPLAAKVVLSVGEINKNKNHRVGIEALAKLNNTNLYYVICGQGPLMQELKELAKRLYVDDRVIFAGYRTDVSDFYKMADLFLFPSFREGLPVAMMEAMASGLPVIATRIRGCKDLINSEDLYEPTDVDGISKALQDPCLINTDINPDISITSITEKIKQIYKLA